MDRAPVRRAERATTRLGPTGLRQHLHTGEWPLALALEEVVEELLLTRLQHRDVGRLVLTALVPVVEELEPDERLRVERPRAVVVAQRLVDREQVVGPAVRDQERRGLVRGVDVVRRVVLL